MQNEWDWVEWLKNHAGKPPRNVRATWHEDATCWSDGSFHYVLSVDQFIEDYHFKKTWLAPQAIGRKAVVRAISDVLVKGARPWMIWTAVTFPRTISKDFLPSLYGGVIEACRISGARLVGGDTAEGPKIALSVTVLGRMKSRPILRFGIRPGDNIWLIGTIGWTGIGLHILQNMPQPLHLFPDRLKEQTMTVVRDMGIDPSLTTGVYQALKAFVNPSLPSRYRTWLQKNGRASIDISDGLVRDLERLARVNRVALHITSDSLGFSRVYLKLCRSLGLDPLKTALYGGEDYAWIVGTRPRAKAPFGRSAKRIGKVSTAGKPGVYLDNRLVTGGWDVFDHS